MKNYLFVIIFILSASCSQKNEMKAQKPTLTVLSSRGTHLIEPLFKEFTKETGIPIEISNNKAGVLLTLLKNQSVKADLLLTTDLGSLSKASSEGVLEAASFIPDSNYPQEYSDPEKKWFGLSRRTRVIFYNPSKVKENNIDLNKVTYEGLSDQKFKNFLCLRTSKKVYNQALVADLLERHQEIKTQKILEGWVKNLAAPVFASDREVIKAVAKGKCVFGIANSYYLGKLEEKINTEDVKILWNEASPSHVNLSGIGLIKNAPHKKEAEALISWLMSEKAQHLFASVNYEYPVIESIKSHQLLEEFGKPIVKAPTYLKNYEKLHSQAMELIEKSGYQ